MSIIKRTIAFLFVIFFVIGAATPIVNNAESITSVEMHDIPTALSSTNYIVNVRIFNHLQAFNDDDFQFTVRNGTIPLANAWVRLFNSTTMALEDEEHTDGNGIAFFYNLPVGTYKWNVSHATDPLTHDKTGIIVSDGPEANVNILFGNVDWDNDEDDLNATITDIEYNLAKNLNFSIHFIGNDSLWAYSEVVNGEADFQDLPDGGYTWRIRVINDILYSGYLVDWGTVLANGTQLLVYQSIGPLTGNPEYYDLEVFTYYETSLEPIDGALVNVTYKNGTVWGTQFSPANGTVRFIDLPVAFMNWTVTLGGLPIGLGNYYYDLTSVSADVRPPILTSPGNQEFLYDTENMTITWHIEDEYPDLIRVYVNNVLNKTTDWVNSTYNYVFNVSAAFDVFRIENFEIKLVAIDQNMNYATDIISLRLYENVTPMIDGPDDIEFYYSETGYSLIWNLTDDFLSKYSIMHNGELVASGDIDPDNPVIKHILDGLEIGVYNITIHVNDTSGNVAIDEVIVTVLADSTAPVLVFTPSDIYYNQGDRGIVRNWTVTDDFKDYFTIEIDGEIILTEDWTTENIEFDFSGLRVGTYQFKLTAYDIGGNSVESIVNVYVFQPVVVTYLTWIAGISAGIIILIFVVWFIRFR